MSFYLWIRAMQEPFDLGRPDSSGRGQYVLNIFAEKGYSASFAEEVCTRLATALSLTQGTNLFLGSVAKVPETGTVVVVRETGGAGPLYIQNTSLPNHQRPSAHILFRSEDIATAKALAFSAYASLSVVTNTTLTP